MRLWVRGGRKKEIDSAKVKDRCASKMSIFVEPYFLRIFDEHLFTSKAYLREEQEWNFTCQKQKLNVFTKYKRDLFFLLVIKFGLHFNLFHYYL